LARARALMHGGRYEEAARLLESLRERDDWRMYHYLGICCEKTGRRLKAIEYYARAAERCTDNYRPFFRLGLLYIETGDYARALVMMRKVKELNPNFLAGRFYLAQAAFGVHRFKESLENFTYILRRESYNPGSLAGIGVIKYYQGDPDQAIGFLLRSLGYAPRWVWGRFQLGMMYLEKGDLAEAEAQFRLALRYEPENAAVLYHLALVLEEEDKNAEEREKIYKGILGRKPAGGEEAMVKAAVLIRKKRYAEAEDLLLDLLSRREQLFEAYRRLGYVYAVTGRHARGAECYAEALKIRPDDIGVRYNYAVLLQRCGRKEAAEREFDRILEVYPLSARDHFLQAVVCGRRGDLARAEKLLAAALSFNRFNLRAREMLVSILVRNNRLREAALVAEEIYRLTPGNRDVASLLADIWMKLGRYGQAEEILKEIIDWRRLDVGDVLHVRLLYALYRETGRHREAEELEKKMRAAGVPVPAEEGGGAF